MKLLDRAREGVEDVQARRELQAAYVVLGRKAAELVRAGELEHPELDPLAARVEALLARHEEPPAAA